MLVDAHRAYPVDFAQPLVVVSAWHATGAMYLGLLGLGIVVLALVYLAMLRRVGRGGTAQLAYVALAVAALLTAALLAPVIFSSDVYAYAAYGDLAAHGVNPYIHTTMHNDALLAAAQWQWSNALPSCVYGPLFVGIARILVTTLAPDVLAQLDAFRILAGLALLTCIPLAYAAFAGLPRERRVWAALAIGANPLAIWSAAEGHNDAIIVAIVLAAVALARRFGPAIGAFIAMLAVGVKAPGLAGVVAILVAYRTPMRAVTSALAGAVAGALVIALALQPYAGGLFAPGTHGPYLAFVSLQGIWPPLGIAAAIGIFAWGCLRVARGEAEGWLLTALGIWLAIPNPQPWYGIWFLPIAALAPKTRTAAVILGFSLTTFLRYVPDAVGTPSASANIGLSILACLPLLLLCLPLRSTR